MLLLLFLSLLPSKPHTVHQYTLHYTVPTFNSCTKCLGSLGIIHDRTPDCTQFSGYGCHHKSLTLQLNVALIRKLRGSLRCLAYFVDLLSTGGCATRHWETSGRLVQELNTCTVIVTSYMECHMPRFLLGRL